MPRFFVGDTSHVTFRYESGTFAFPTGANTWIGLVTNHSVDENMGVIPIRYVNTNSRLTQQYLDGPQSFTNSITYHPQDFRMLKFVLGSCVDGGSPSPYVHNYSPNHNNANSAEIVNLPLSSFSITDAKNSGVAGSNFVRTFSGCIANTWSLSINQGEPAVCELGYVAQNMVFSSGALPNISGTDTTRPYMWQDARLRIPSGTVFNEVETLSLNIANNLETPHYVDNNRTIGQPIPTNLDVTLTATVNATAELTKGIHDQYWLGGSQENILLSLIQSTGSEELLVTLSGAKLTAFSNPTTSTGVQKISMTWSTGSIFAQESNTNQFHNFASGAGF